MPPGRLKLKAGGGHGGHNGLRDIIQHLGSSSFKRLRIGIGHPGHKDLVLNYVLGKPTSVERQQIYDAFERVYPVISNLSQGKIAEAMNQLNS